MLILEIPVCYKTIKKKNLHNGQVLQASRACPEKLCNLQLQKYLKHDWKKALSNLCQTFKVCLEMVILLG